MKGNNELRLCESALITMVQAYLDREFGQDFGKVTGVSEVPGTGHAFVVKLIDKAEQDAA